MEVMGGPERRGGGERILEVRRHWPFSAPPTPPPAEVGQLGGCQVRARRARPGRAQRSPATWKTSRVLRRQGESRGALGNAARGPRGPAEFLRTHQAASGCPAREAAAWGTLTLCWHLSAPVYVALDVESCACGQRAPEGGTKG